MSHNTKLVWLLGIPLRILCLVGCQFMPFSGL